MSATKFAEMTDSEVAEYEAALVDPSTIQTHEKALEIIDYLEHEIAAIETALELARMEAAYAPLPEHREMWVRRATYACGRKRGQRKAVYERDQEIRGVVGLGVIEQKNSLEMAQKHERAMAHHAVALASKQEKAEKSRLAAAELTAAKDWRRHFVVIAQLVMTNEQYRETCAEAKRRMAVTAGDAP